MKRIEAVIPSNRLNLVVSAIEESGVTGITTIEAKGRGKGARPSLRSSRGTSTQIAEYNSLATIITIVEDSRVDQIISAILNTASTGSSGDGKIFVSTIDDVIDIQTKKKGLT
ncbi:P-II family nitrogen regulator [Candidatus Nitrosotenuis aquarius]|uniref:P-II family nitrogen regulator n=1 Tax=Candidatus Nitrosotenuis aquarius TaxID=1846278 RepID=UPI000C1EA6C0|nr:P-II family nitrogen regulator [Candidatus Nitrosotenuis aquarius]